MFNIRNEAELIGDLPPDNATDEQLEAWRSSVDSDAMGFYGAECPPEGWQL